MAEWFFPNHRPLVDQLMELSCGDEAARQGDGAHRQGQAAGEEGKAAGKLISQKGDQGHQGGGGAAKAV